MYQGKLINILFKGRECHKDFDSELFGDFVLDTKIMQDFVIPRIIDKDIALTELKQVKDVFNELKIKLFLTHGSCLGAVREKDFINYDSDIDCGCYKDDLDGVILAVQMLRDKYNFKITKVSINDESIAIIKNNVIIDIDLYKVVGRNWQSNKTDILKIPYRFLERLEDVDFLGMKIKVPNNVEAYLKFQYGSDWRIPVKDFYNPYRLKIEQPVIKILKFIIGKKLAIGVAKKISNFAKKTKIRINA